MAWGNGQLNGEDAPVALTALQLLDPQTIRPRPWIYGHLLLRGAVTLLVAPGGTGKTALTTAITLACASGKDLMAAKPHRAMTVVNIALEESQEEMQRRFAAAIIHFDLDADDLAGRVLVHDARQSGFLIASIDPGTGQPQRLPEFDAFKESLRFVSCDVLTVDPLALCHGLDENQNAHMAFLIRLFNEIALLLDCAVLIVHHTRKGAIAGDPDGIRGAGALINHARIAVGLMPMDDLEAEKLNVLPLDRKRTLRLDDLKRNYSPKGTDAIWFQLESVPLGNATPDYPFGDSVQVPVLWSAPLKKAVKIAPDLAIAIIDTIGAGIANEQGPERYSAAPAAKTRAAYKVAIKISAQMGLPISEQDAKKLVNGWVQDQVLLEETYYSKSRRADSIGLVINERKRPSPEPALDMHD